eukprot:TRINITY_DN6336_c0_g1_i1.p1 TRINITY_DN6336_c0_g1~~TRINITY_DN6336_c0_g1_i1.p1  ORF type:complete len:432 (-),score=156.65 TRINITY_DN6336_c0_g1_i1:237-1532(-)
MAQATGDEERTVVMTLALFSSVTGKQPSECDKANLSKRRVRELDVDVTSACAKCLTRLDLSYNALSDARALGSALGFLKELKWLSVAHNALTSLSFVAGLRKLTVLNASNNAITRMDFASGLPSLMALILNNNEISIIENLTEFNSLNTLVVSHNKITELSGIFNLKKLKKISCTDNKIYSIPDLRTLTEFTELRLTRNRIQKIPATLQQCPSLRILDIGANCITTLKEFEMLQPMKKLQALNVAGNPVTNKAGFSVGDLLDMLPNLATIDGRPAHMIFRKSGVMSPPPQKKKKKVALGEAQKQSKFEKPAPKATTVLERKRIKPAEDENPKATPKQVAPKVPKDEGDKAPKAKATPKSMAKPKPAPKEEDEAPAEPLPSKKQKRDVPAAQAKPKPKRIAKVAEVTTGKDAVAVLLTDQGEQVGTGTESAW